MSQVVYLNGSLVPLEQAKISVMDYGFLYGYGLFETMRAYNGKVFGLDRHLTRLGRSAEVLGINVDVTLLEKAVYETVRANGLSEARIRLIVTIGEGSVTPDPGTCARPTLVVIAVPYHAYSPEVYEKGWRVNISTIRRNSQSPLPNLKSSNFLESMLARQESRMAGLDDTLLLNDKGFLAEASSSNVFIVSGGVLKTPPRSSGLLPGVTREMALELAERLSIRSAETDIALDELMSADEVFLTNSMIEIMPVTTISGKAISTGTPGPVTRKLMQAYKELVRMSA